MKFIALIYYSNYLNLQTNILCYNELDLQF